MLHQGLMSPGTMRLASLCKIGTRQRGIVLKHRHGVDSPPRLDGGSRAVEVIAALLSEVTRVFDRELDHFRQHMEIICCPPRAGHRRVPIRIMREHFEMILPQFPTIESAG